MPVKVNYMTDETGKPIRESFQIMGFHREVTEAEKDAIFQGIFPPTMRTRRGMRIQCEILEDTDIEGG